MYVSSFVEKPQNVCTQIRHGHKGIAINKRSKTSFPSMSSNKH